MHPQNYSKHPQQLQQGYHESLIFSKSQQKDISSQQYQPYKNKQSKQTQILIKNEINLSKILEQKYQILKQNILRNNNRFMCFSKFIIRQKIFQSLRNYDYIFSQRAIELQLSQVPSIHQVQDSYSYYNPQIIFINHIYSSDRLQILQIIKLIQYLSDHIHILQCYSSIFCCINKKYHQCFIICFRQIISLLNSVDKQQTDHKDIQQRFIQQSVSNLFANDVVRVLYDYGFQESQQLFEDLIREIYICSKQLLQIGLIQKQLEDDNFCSNEADTNIIDKLSQILSHFNQSCMIQYQFEDININSQHVWPI